MTRHTGRRHRCRLGRLALIFGAIWAVCACVMCLTYREYGRSASYVAGIRGESRGTSSGSVVSEGTDSVASSLCRYIRSPYVAKGGALSAMDGDYSRLLVQSLVPGKVNDELKSFNPETSTLAMRKMCVWQRKGKIHLSYFSTDSVATARTFSYFEKKLLDAAGNEVSLRKLEEKTCPLTLPWRSAAALAAVLLAIWLLVFIISRIFFPRRKAGYRSIEEFSSAISGETEGNALIGGLEDVPPMREKYSNALRWKSQAEAVADAVKEAVAGSPSPLVNILGMTSSDLFKFKRARGLAALVSGSAVHVMESGRDLDASSTAYRYPDIARLMEDNSANMLLIVHPPLSDSTVPEAYTENAALNILVCDASDGWTEAHRALFESIPECKVVLVGMETGTVAIKEKYQKEIKKAGKLKGYIPSEKRWRYIVLLSECADNVRRDFTCRSLYDSACGDSSRDVSSKSETDRAADPENLMEVSALRVDYKVIAFRRTSGRILENLDFSSSDADAVIILKAGCSVSPDFFSDISAALSAGQECAQCRVNDKGYTIRPSHRSMLRDMRRGRLCPLLRYGFALTRSGLEKVKASGTGKESEHLSDYLSNTIVNFS